MIDSFLTWEQLPEDASQGKEVPQVVKSEEELAKFTVDERLSDVERAVLFLSNGQLIQQKHAIQNLPGVIRGRGRPAWDALAQPLKAVLNRLDADAQIEAANAFATIAKERLMPSADLQACLLPVVCRNINKEKSEEETEAWLQALFQLVPLLDKDTLKSEVMSLALSKGDVEENIGSRVICVRILGALAPHMTRDEVEKGFFKKAMTLCQDVDYQTRISMCQQLATIGRAVGRDLTTKSVLEELFELLKDEEVQVRVAALTSLVSLIDILAPEVRKAKVMPVLRDHMQPFELDIAMQRCIAQLFGQILNLVKTDLEEGDIQMFYGCFKHLAAKSDVALRRACAQQFPTMLRAATAISSSSFALQFHDTLSNLATDPDEDVRVLIASQFHEIARQVGNGQCVNLLMRPLVRLLRDDCMRVQAATLPMINATLQHFVVVHETKREEALGEIVRALVDLEANASHNWRIQANLANAFTGFPGTFTSDQIYENFLPMACRFLSSAAAAVRPPAAEGITAFFRHNKKDKQRGDMFLRLIRDFARARSYGQRLAFADVVAQMIRKFSSKFVKEWIFDLCLELLYDPVPNVRLQITHILPNLKQTIKLPEDVDLLERLNNAISNSMTDNDRDVSQIARCINDTFKRTPVRMVGGAGLMDMNGMAGGGMFNYEAEDKKREEEEADFTFLPEDAKEIKAEILQVALNKKKGAGSAGQLGDLGSSPKGANIRRSGSGEPVRPLVAAAKRSEGSPLSSANSSPNTRSTAARTMSTSSTTTGRPSPTSTSAVQQACARKSLEHGGRPGATAAAAPAALPGAKPPPSSGRVTQSAPSPVRAATIASSKPAAANGLSAPKHATVAGAKANGLQPGGKPVVASSVALKRK